MRSMQRLGWLRRKVLPHGDDGTAVTIPQDARREAGVEPGDSLPVEYDRESEELIIHLGDASPPESDEAAD